LKNDVSLLKEINKPAGRSALALIPERLRFLEIDLFWLKKK
jgi:hypothetical protein